MRLEAIAAPLMMAGRLAANVNTDTIIRVERGASFPRGELGRWAFEPLRYGADGNEAPEFVLNGEPYRRAKILVAGANFACGSSRETAVWVLWDFGIRCVIAPSFGGIFYENAFQNGLLAVRLPAAQVEALAAAVAQTARACVDLPTQQISAAGFACGFDIEPLRRRLLLEGQDQIGLTLSYNDAIAAFEARDRVRKPWQV